MLLDGVNHRHLGLQAASQGAFDTIRERLIERGHRAGRVGFACRYDGVECA